MAVNLKFSISSLQTKFTLLLALKIVIFCLHTFRDKLSDFMQWYKCCKQPPILNGTYNKVNKNQGILVCDTAHIFFVIICHIVFFSISLRRLSTNHFIRTIYKSKNPGTKLVNRLLFLTKRLLQTLRLPLIRAKI